MQPTRIHMLEHRENEFALNPALNLVQLGGILLSVPKPADKLTEQINGGSRRPSSGKVLQGRARTAEGAAPEYAAPFPPSQSGDSESSATHRVVRVIWTAPAEPPYGRLYLEGSERNLMRVSRRFDWDLLR